jgi:hypothetical protein
VGRVAGGAGNSRYPRQPLLAANGSAAVASRLAKPSRPRRGAFVGTATNLDTEKTVKINEGGSFSVVQHSDGTVTVTSNGFVISSLFGTIFSGHSVLELDANGNVTSRTFDGREEDLCAELAGP